MELPNLKEVLNKLKPPKLIKRARLCPTQKVLQNLSHFLGSTCDRIWDNLQKTIMNHLFFPNGLGFGAGFITGRGIGLGIGLRIGATSSITPLGGLAHIP